MGACKGQFAGDKNPAWRGGHIDYRGANWQEQKKLVLEKANGRCQKCGKIRKLIVNHKIPFRLFSSYLEANTLDNLEALCHKCHGKTDSDFWLKHPLFYPTRHFPQCRVFRHCEKCKKIFPAKPRQKICDDCHKHTCEICGKEFISYREINRQIRFCSKSCNVAFRKQEAKYPHQCQICGKRLGRGTQKLCRVCWLTKAPYSLRYPAQKPGRKPKGQPVI